MTAEPLYIAFKCDGCKQFVSAKLSVRDNGRGTKYQQLYCSVCSKTTGQKKFQQYPGPNILQATTHVTSNEARDKAKQNEVASLQLDSNM